jgi:diadenosine tetraphosphatase ApaH/serine/threonine PP2A family protein phosphatase
VAGKYGFRDDLLTLYSESVFDEFVDVFEWMPIAAVVANDIFCVHGGIGPSLHRLSQIAELTRPVDESALLRELLWADPNPAFQNFNDGDRGRNVEFGPFALSKFFQANRLSFLVRGHQCVDGVVFTPGMNVATVFSSSNYQPLRPNRAGVLIIDAAGQKRHVIWPDRVNAMLRTEAMFWRVADHDERQRNKLVLPSQSRSSSELMLSIGAKKRARPASNVLLGSQLKMLVVPKVQPPTFVL